MRNPTPQMDWALHCEALGRRALPASARLPLSAAAAACYIVSPRRGARSNGERSILKELHALLDRPETPAEFHLRIEIPKARIDIGIVGEADVLAEIILPDGPTFSREDREVAMIAMLYRMSNLIRGEQGTQVTITDLSTGAVICDDGKPCR